MMRKTSGPKGKTITGEWGRLHTEKIHDMYSSPNIMCDHIEKNFMGWVGSMNGREKRCICWEKTLRA